MKLDIDIAKAGKQQGFFRIPHSTNESANGWIPLPAVSLRNGTGPRILGLGAVHGDEFEGQIAWTKLALRLAASDISGHLLIMPAVNLPSALAASRVSPIDDVNLNRCFPGDARGTPTHRIAHLIERELLPQFDYVLDIHSGGNSSLYLPGPTVAAESDPAQEARMIELLKVFGAPNAYVFDESGGGDAALIGGCGRIGTKRMGSEMGGGGGATPETVRLTDQGLLRVLVHLGALSSRFLSDLPPPAPTRLLRRRNPRSDHYLYAPEPGVFEPFIELGDKVTAGDPLGQILFPETPWRAPVPLHSSGSGILICRRARGRCARGDGLTVLGEEMED